MSLKVIGSILIRNFFYKIIIFSSSKTLFLLTKFLNNFYFYMKIKNDFYKIKNRKQKIFSETKQALQISWNFPHNYSIFYLF